MSPQKMLKFTDIPRVLPPKRETAERTRDYNEIYQDYAQKKATEQSSRCSQCGVPFCQSHCPLHNNIPDWLRFTAEGRLQEAYELSQATNTFPEICGRICPQDRLCEGNCVIEQSNHGTVTIGAIEKYITDAAWENGWVRGPAPKKERGESIGIIGAGPGGLAAADMLRRFGFQVVIYDSYDRAGGLMTYGIPGFKLEKDAVTRRIDLLEKSGVKFVLNCRIGVDKTFNSVRKKHDIILIATGVYVSRELDKINGNLNGIVPALEYLTASNKIGFGDEVAAFDSGELNAKGKKTLVIGGGDTAMDCVRTAVRQGAKSVKCLYRRDRANMPGSARETQNAEEEGVEFIWQTSPKGFKGDTSVTGAIMCKMRLGLVDSSGRNRPEVIAGSEWVEPADLVIEALGFTAEDLPSLWNQPDLRLTRWGTIFTDSTTHQTALDGVYAVGDIVRGASLVVWAIRDGREAATAILADLDKKARYGSSYKPAPKKAQQAA